MDDDLIKRAGDYMLVETPLARADICVLFGNPHADHLAEGAADLFDAGYFDRVIVSGGVLTDDGRTEAHRMRDVLVARGMPEKDIIVENLARSTIENVIYCMAALDEMGALGGINSLLGIGHMQASRRFLMTLERHWPEPVKMFTTSNCFGVPREHWHTSPELKHMVLDEYTRAVPGQLEKDFIREIDLAGMARRIAGLPPPVRRR
jgi:uncharacterized SAM-binding protein YcdF (DUF218 family)